MISIGVKMSPLNKSEANGQYGATTMYGELDMETKMVLDIASVAFGFIKANKGLLHFFVMLVFGYLDHGSY